MIEVHVLMYKFKIVHLTQSEIILMDVHVFKIINGILKVLHAIPHVSKIHHQMGKAIVCVIMVTHYLVLLVFLIHALRIRPLMVKEAATVLTI